MVELVDTRDSKSLAHESVMVQVPLEVRKENYKKMGNYMNMEIKDVETAELYMNSQLNLGGELEVFCAEWPNKDCLLQVKYVCDDFTHVWKNKYSRCELGLPSEYEMCKSYVCVKEDATKKAIDLFFRDAFAGFFEECRSKWINTVHIDSGDNKNRVQNFLDEYKDLCKKYNLSLSHEDGHGAFIIENYQEYNIDWVEGAFIEVEEE